MPPVTPINVGEVKQSGWPAKNSAESLREFTCMPHPDANVAFPWVVLVRQPHGHR